MRVNFLYLNIIRFNLSHFGQYEKAIFGKLSEKIKGSCTRRQYSRIFSTAIMDIWKASFPNLVYYICGVLRWQRYWKSHSILRTSRP